jgi:hypothetical protein
MEPLPHRRSDGVDVLGPTVLPSGPVLVIEGTLDRWLSPPRSRGVSRAERPLAGVGRSPIPSTTTAPWGAGVSWGDALMPRWPTFTRLSANPVSDSGAG